jgi:hypothetical protein
MHTLQGFGCIDSSASDRLGTGSGEWRVALGRCRWVVVQGRVGIHV